MHQKANYFKLGLFVIIASVLGAAFLIIFGAGEFFKKELLAETYFNESVQGLTIGSEVKYKGIKIGSVKTITSAARIYSTKSDYVLVIMSLDQGIFLGQQKKKSKERILQAIYDGLTVQLAFKGLTGAAYLETDYAQKTNSNFLNISWTPVNIYIPSRQSNIKQFGNSINQILDSLTSINIQGITNNIDSLLETLIKKISTFDVAKVSYQISSLLDELKKTSTKLNQTIESDKVENLIADASVSFSELKNIIESSKEPLNQAISDFQRAAGNTRDITDQFEKKVGSNIDSLSFNLDKFMENLAVTSDMLANMVWTNSDKVKLILENLEATSDNLKQLSKDIKKYPGRLFFESPPEKIDLKKISPEKNKP